MSQKTGRIRLSAWAGILLLAAGSLTAADPKANLAIRNARVWTGDPNRPWAQAVAVAGGHILAVGANDDIGAWVGPSTRVVDGRGAALLPGLIDAHFHLLDLSTTGGEVPLNLRFVAGREELVTILASQAQEVPEGTWIFGEGWDQRKWGGELPSKAWIDRATPRHPVWLLNANGDSGLANSAALREAGIGRDTVEPPLEGIVRDRNRDPTGLMRGGPMWLMDRALAEKTSGSAGNKAKETMNRLAALGVTSIHHTGNWQELLIFQWLRKAGRLKTRIYAGVPLPAWVRMRDYATSHGRGDAWLHWGSLKLFKMTWTPGPAVDKAGRRDRWAVQPSADEVYSWFAGATQAGLQTMVHAGGYEILKIYERISKELKPKDPRFRIEHAHDVPPKWIALYAAAGVIASVQPPLLAHIDDRTLAGVAPPRHLFPCRELLDAGVRIVLGTDAVTASPLLSPFEVLAEAVERPGPDGRRLTLEQALVAYTRDAAYAEFSEDMKGTLEPGKLADLILLDRDIFAAPITDLRQTQVRLTVVDGRIVHDLDRPAGRATSRGLSGPPPASP
jgi:predicted amidohydrolase YtcJ